MLCGDAVAPRTRAPYDLNAESCVLARESGEIVRLRARGSFGGVLAPVRSKLEALSLEERKACVVCHEIVGSKNRRQKEKKWEKYKRLTGSSGDF